MDNENNSTCDSLTRISGNWYNCQLPKGHGGKHVFSVSWDADTE